MIEMKKIIDPYKIKTKDEHIMKFRPMVEWLLKNCIDGDKLSFVNKYEEASVVVDRTGAKYILIRRKEKGHE